MQNQKESDKSQDCLFCKIVEGKIPSYKVYEDDNFVGFLNIKPHTKGHTLLIPKNHYSDILEMPENLNTLLFDRAQTFAKKMKQIFESKKIAYMLAGLEVNHTHLHLFPLNQISDLDTSSAYEASKEELQEVQKLLTN